MVIWVVEFSREGYEIRKVFGQKSIYQKDIHNSIFRIFRIVPSHHKLGIILETKCFKNCTGYLKAYSKK